MYLRRIYICVCVYSAQVHRDAVSPGTDTGPDITTVDETMSARSLASEARGGVRSKRFERGAYLSQRRRRVRESNDVKPLDDISIHPPYTPVRWLVAVYDFGPRGVVDFLVCVGKLLGLVLMFCVCVLYVCLV